MPIAYEDAMAETFFATFERNLLGARATGASTKSFLAALLLAASPALVTVRWLP